MVPTTIHYNIIALLEFSISLKYLFHLSIFCTCLVIKLCVFSTLNLEDIVAAALIYSFKIITFIKKVNTFKFIKRRIVK